MARDASLTCNSSIRLVVLNLQRCLNGAWPLSVDNGLQKLLSVLKMKTVFKYSLASAALFGTTLAQADRRAFTHTYEYVTQNRDALELEYYVTQKQAKFDAASSRSMEQQIELEYGITDHWDISVYQVLGQSGDGPLRYTATKVRTRYRFAERGQLPVDSLLYFEVKRPAAGSSWTLEPKAVLAKDVGNATIAVNLVPEVVIAREAGATEVEFEPGWALGATWELCPQWKIGAETWGALEHPFDDGRELISYVGPAISWAPSDKFWISTTVAAGLTDDSADAEVRAILAVGL